MMNKGRRRESKRHWRTTEGRTVMKMERGKQMVLDRKNKEWSAVDLLMDSDNKHTGRVKQSYRQRTLEIKNNMSNAHPKLTNTGNRESKVLINLSNIC